MENQVKALNSLNESLNLIPILDNVSDFVYYMSLDNRIIWVNKTIRDACNVEIENLAGRFCYEVFHNGSNICEYCPVKEVNIVDQPQEGEVPFKNDAILNHKSIPVKDSQGNVIGIIVITHNISLQRNAEVAIEKAETVSENERLLMDLLMDNIPDRVYFKDLESRFIRVNKAMAHKHGNQDPKLMEKRSDFELFSHEHAVQAFNDEMQIIQTGKPILNIEEKETYEDGRITWALTSKMPLFDHEGKISGTFGISHDITNRKIAEEKINLYVNELKELNATKDKFFSIIAHDLKNPFNNILGFSELLKEEVRETDLDTIEIYANKIYSSAHQTFRLLENLLDWANTHRGHMIYTPEDLSLSEVTSEIIENLMQYAQKKEIDLQNKIQEGVRLLADRNMLKSILRNLITNAIKFTPMNGKVEIFSVAYSGEVKISVKDTGIGMTEKVKNELFRLDINHSTKGTANENGTGLGLILSKEFVQKSGGLIWVETELGKGSTFNFTLPLNKEE